MSEWLPALPALLLAVGILLLPGLAVAYAAGVRGIAGWGVAPGLGMTVLAGGAAVAPVMHLPWNPWLLVAATAAGAGLAGLARLAVLAMRPRTGRVLGAVGRDPALTSWFALAGTLVGAGTVLAAALPGIGRPGELVDSTDAVAHLSRIRRFLDTGVFSSLGSPGHAAYPSAFHDLAGTLALVVPGLADGRAIVTAANLSAVAAAAVAWPVGVVALSRLTFGRSGVVLVGAGLVSAAFTAFPYLLMGWGVLWPNLLGTALLPGVLGPALVATGCLGPVRGLPRPLAALVATGALTGLTLAHPNALVSLVMVVVLAVATRFALQARHLDGTAGRRARVRLGALGVVVAVGVLAVPRMSRAVADTASYDWGARARLGPSLRDSVLLGLQVGVLPWGLLGVMAVGGVVCVRRGRLRWVPVTWAACVVLFVVAATGRPGWGSLLTGYWYNDKVRLAALLVVPAALMGVAGLQALARGLSWLLRAFTPDRSAGWRRPPALAATSSAGALVLVAAVTAGASHDQASGMVDRYYHPRQRYQELLTNAEDADLARLAALIPPGVVTADVPANGSAFLYAFHGRPVLFDSLLLDPNPDHALIGLHLKEAVTRTDVCDALRRDNVQYAVTGPVRYWLSLSSRTTGMAALGGTSGFLEVGAAGRYRLYRIQACGFDPAWLPPASTPGTPPR